MISVIIPTWNRAALLKKAIQSVLAQTVPPLEVLVCDDGSMDNSRWMVESLGDRRVRFLGSSHGGRPAIPRNRGIREARGEWLAFLDDDDEWLPEKLEKEIALAQRLNCLAVCSNALRVLPGEATAENYLAFDEQRLTLNDLLQVNLVICSSAVIHRSLIPLVEGFPENQELTALEDYALWLRIATQTDFAYLAEPLVRYRDQPLAGIRTSGPGRWEQRRRVFADFLRWQRAKKVHGVPFAARLYYNQAFVKSIFESGQD